MKKQFLFVLLLLLTAAVVTATVFSGTKKATAPKKEKCTITKSECSAKKMHCPLSGVACY